MCYIGIFGAGRLDKSDPSLNLIASQQKAAKMLLAKNDMHLIKRQTGWEMGVDGKWRYELADPLYPTQEIEDHLKNHFGESINIRYCMHDTSLLIAYPKFEQLQLYATYTSTKSTAGYFSPTNYGMVVSMGTANSPFEFQTEGILLHEVQHLIQNEEGFARGGSPSSGKRLYIRLAGEVEARNVCTRHLLTPEQRKTLLRTETQDVPDVEQFIVF